MIRTYRRQKQLWSRTGLHRINIDTCRVVGSRSLGTERIVKSPSPAASLLFCGRSSQVVGMVFFKAVGLYNDNREEPNGLRFFFPLEHFH